MKGVYEDLSGKDFGAMHVIKRDFSKNNKHVYYLVQCMNCGYEFPMRVDDIKRNPHNCKHCMYPDLTGKRFGMLIVLGASGDKDTIGHKYWDCLCECGNLFTVLGTNLLQGKTQTCGCKRYDIVAEKEIIDITGQKYGKLTALERLGRAGSSSIWRCSCECGNTIDVRMANLRNGHTQSCGCMRSAGEYQIRSILTDHDVDFIPECRFEEMPDRRFDFALVDKANNLKCMLEYDGKQHFEMVPAWHKNEETFANAVKRDDDKNNFCTRNGIPLYRIRFDEDVNDSMKNILNEFSNLPSLEYTGVAPKRILRRTVTQ